MAYHYIRIHMQDKARPHRLQQVARSAYGEPVWAVELVSRQSGNPEGLLVIGVDTGSIYGWHPVTPSLLSEGTASGAASTRDAFTVLVDLNLNPSGPAETRRAH
jgi:hypothetical protein